MDCCPLGRDWPNQNAQSAMHCIKSRKKCQNPKISIFLWWHLYHSFNFLGTTPKSLDQNMIYLDFYFLLSVYQFRHATDHQTTIQLATGRPTRRHIQAVNIGINDDVNNDDIIWQLWPFKSYNVFRHLVITWSHLQSFKIRPQLAVTCKFASEYFNIYIWQWFEAISKNFVRVPREIIYLIFWVYLLAP